MPEIFPLSSLIDQIVNHIKKESLKLQKPEPQNPNKTKSYTKLLKSIADFRGRPLLYPYLSSGLGHGPLVQLDDGSVKLDFVCGIGPHILGHSHPELIRSALKGALEDSVMQGHLQMGKIYEKLLQKLLEISGEKSRLSHVWLCPSGSMANENALKVIRQKNKAQEKFLPLKELLQVEPQ